MNVSLVALEISVLGIVQGVGFRPFVYNLAKELGLKGSVRNSGGAVLIQLHGPEDAAQQFLQRIREKPPVLAQLTQIQVRQLTGDEKPLDLQDFSILDSEDEDSAYFMMGPDASICDSCTHELLDPADRRFQYPFINCTHCGPRFTIIRDLPYDRAQTTMSSFPMCDECAAEYTDPSDRRFHAQPNACWKCGPQLSFVPRHQAAARAMVEDMERAEPGEHLHHHMPAPQGAALAQAIQLLQNGGILALKGLGGFQLICDASNEKVVKTLRDRKRRTGKPFAVMFPNVESIESLCAVSDTEKELLIGKERPIVLLRYKNMAEVSPQVAECVTNGNLWLGAMLPYTPLHVLLLKDFDGALVATSGNTSEEPIAIDNADALIKLQGLADGFLLHNRDIETRFDDSVTAVFDDTPIVLRRARGYAPQALVLPMVASDPAGHVVLSLGAHLKNTFCMMTGSHAYISQHLGDLNNLETFEFFEETIFKYQQLFRMEVHTVACDLHPDYLSSKLAARIAEAAEIPLIKVQHHHAHIASCMAENGLRGPVIGVSFDGTGLGTDGTIWGGEFFLADYDKCARIGSLMAFPVVGGDAAIRHPWKIAVSILHGIDTPAAGSSIKKYAKLFGDNTLTLLRKQIKTNVGTINTTSAGRVFDAVASILGYCHDSTYEADAPSKLESAAWRATGGTMPTMDAASALLKLQLVTDSTGKPGDCEFRLDTIGLMNDLTQCVASGIEPDKLALEFHKAIAQGLTDACLYISKARKNDTVCLSGGVFQNSLLYSLVTKSLRAQGLKVFTHSRVPCDDGGISLGQSLVAMSQTGNLKFAQPD